MTDEHDLEALRRLNQRLAEQHPIHPRSIEHHIDRSEDAKWLKRQRCITLLKANAVAGAIAWKWRRG